VQRRSKFSADQQFHADEWKRLEKLLVELTSEANQRRKYLENPHLSNLAARQVRARLDEIDRERASIFEELFFLGIMHSVIYLQRSAWQVAPELLSRLIFSALPDLVPIKTHIMEVKEGYWLLNQLLFGRLLIAWRALRSALVEDHGLSDEELRSRSPDFALWEFVMEELIEPSVLLADGCRGRTYAGALEPCRAWPLVLIGLKRGLRLLLLSGRHHLYCDCFGREIRQLHLLSEDEFAWWANNLWVRVGGSRFFNDETVERFLIKTLKQDMEGGHFTEREAARSAATVDALQMVREELRAMIGGVRPDKADQASAEARHLVQRPGVPATLYASLVEFVRPSIEYSLAVSRQLEIISIAANYDAGDETSWQAASPFLVRHWDEDISYMYALTLADELHELNSITGVSGREELAALLKAPRCNPFTGEAMQNTDASVLRAEALDRLRRHVRGNYLNADKGFCFEEPPPSAKKETPIVIGTPPRKLTAVAKKVLREQQQSRWALGHAGVIMGPWDVASPHTHVLFAAADGKPLRVWLPALNVQKAKAWPALVKLLGLKPLGLGNGGLLQLPPLEGRTIRRNVLLSADGSFEIECAAFGVDAFGDARLIYEGPATEEGARTGAQDVAAAFLQRLTSLYRAGFVRGYYPYDIGDVNPYKAVTFYVRAAEAFAKLTPDEQARLVRAGGKLHKSTFSLGETSQSLKAALLDKFFGGREAALRCIGEAVLGKTLVLKGIVPPGCSLTLHGVGKTPQRPITVTVHAPVEPGPGEPATRNAGERRPVEPKVEVSSGAPCPNAEGEDQLWLHAMAETSKGANFIAFISDTDFKEAALVVMPRRLFPDGGGGGTRAGRVFVASVDRGSPQSEPYWCMDELVEAVAAFPALVDGIPGDTPATRRLRCAHMAAALILMGGDTTPSIHGLSEEVGLKAELEWAWYTGPLVEPYVHSASGLEVFRVLPEASVRMHKVWYLHRTAPNIQKLLKYEPNRSRDAQRGWMDAISLETLRSAVLQKVTAPVGVPGQPMRSEANMRIICVVASARMLQWGLSTHPDASLFLAREGLKPLEGHPFGPWTTLIDWDMAETGTQRKRGAAAAPAPQRLSAADLFAKYHNDLSGIDSLPSRPQNERRAVLVAQLVARGAASADLPGKWQELKKLLIATLNQEAPPGGAAPAAAPAAAAATPASPTPAAPVAAHPAADVEMEEVSPEEEDDEEDDEEGAAQESPSSEEEEAEEAPPPRQRFFCCADDKKPGGFWYCPGGCSHSFHHVCQAEHPDLRDGANKVCVPCHVAAQSRGRGARATRQRVV
jgi:hypothetical protein